MAGGEDELQRMFQDIEPAHPFALTLQGLFPHLAAAQAQQAGLSNLGENVGFGHQQVRCPAPLFNLGLAVGVWVLTRDSLHSRCAL